MALGPSDKRFDKMVLSVNGTPVAGLLNVSISRSHSPVEVRDIETGPYGDQYPGTLSWTASCDFNLFASDSALTTSQAALRTAMDNRTRVEVVASYNDGADVEESEGYITSLEFSSTMDQSSVATGAIEIMGAQGWTPVA